jgi:hypothetical protein
LEITELINEWFFRGKQLRLFVVKCLENEELSNKNKWILCVKMAMGENKCQVQCAKKRMSKIAHK